MHTVLKIYLSRGSRADFCPLGPDFCGRWAHSPPVQLFCDTLGFSSDAFSPSNWLPGSQQQSQRLLQSSSEGRKLGHSWWNFPQRYHPVPHTTLLAWNQVGQSPQICTVIIFAEIFWIFLFCFHFTWIYVALGLHLMEKIVVKLGNFFYPFCANFRISDVRTWDLRFSQIYMI